MLLHLRAVASESYERMLDGKLRVADVKETNTEIIN